jgi:hypothetical protein
MNALITNERRPTKLSIIIVSWKTRELLIACLRSLEPQITEWETAHATQIETIVIDNVSTDGSVEAVRHLYPWVRVVENSTNVGFAAANNLALPLCQGELIWLLNPDTVLRPDALAALVRFMDEHPEAGVAGSRLLNADGSLQPSAFPAPTLLRELWRLLHLDKLVTYGQYAMHKWPTTVARTVDAVQGASLITRRTILEQVGFFDPDYFIYTEEIDLCHRIRAAGWKIYWIPQSEVIHYGGQSTQQVARAMFLQLYGSKVVYFRKRRGTVAAQLYKVILLVVALLRLLLTPLSALQSSYQRARQRTLAGHYLHLVLSLHKM